ncbi:MAG TPA: calcium-binding protein [Solirubrobacterales bacterium]
MRRKSYALLVIPALMACALLMTPTSAAPAGKITVRGAASGSHLRLTVSGESIVVDGYMASRHPDGCHFSRRRLVAVCPLAGVSSIEVDMGPSGDLVEVLDHLPIPLTIYLGNGSDKFIGSGEPDTCYPQGARRNRCVGGGGNDVCITGQRNSDCVGGRGSDFCRHGAGSDGCWGGPGRDICLMGPGQDGCHGGPGNDRLYGGSSPDQLYGGPGYDYCDGGPGWGRSHTCEAGPRR